MRIVDPNKLALIRVPVDEMIARMHVARGIGRSKCRDLLLREFRVDWTYVKLNGWYFCTVLGDCVGFPTSQRDHREEEIEEGYAWRVMSNLVDEVFQSYSLELSMQAATLESAEMAVLCALCDEGADLLMDESTARDLYPERPDFDHEEVWREEAREIVEMECGPFLRNLEHETLRDREWRDEAHEREAAC